MTEQQQRPRVVCISGSMRFEQQMRLAAIEESVAGRVVVMPHVNTKRPLLTPLTLTAEEVKEALDALHLARIDLADEVLVVAPGGYIGESTSAEIAYAERAGKPVRYRREPAEPDRAERLAGLLDVADLRNRVAQGTYESVRADDAPYWDDLERPHRLHYIVCANAALAALEPELEKAQKDLQAKSAEVEAWRSGRRWRVLQPVPEVPEAMEHAAALVRWAAAVDETSDLLERREQTQLAETIRAAGMALKNLDEVARRQADELRRLREDEAAPPRVPLVRAGRHNPFTIYLSGEVDDAAGTFFAVAHTAEGRDAIVTAMTEVALLRGRLATKRVLNEALRQEVAELRRQLVGPLRDAGPGA